MGRRDEVLTRLVEQRKKALVYRFVGIAGSACAGLLIPGLEPGTRLLITLALAMGYVLFAHPRIAKSLDLTRRADEARAHPDPTADFTRVDDLVVDVDLDTPALMGVTLDDPVSALAALGPVSDPTDARLGSLVWEDLGITVRVDDDDRLLAFEIACRGDARVRFFHNKIPITPPSVDDDLASALTRTLGDAGTLDESRGVSERTFTRPKGLVSFGAFVPGTLYVSIHLPPGEARPFDDEKPVS
jgi:hypothetical protein